MNFKFMPELTWRLAYPMWWVFAITLTISMITYFRKKKWL